ncbi:hypothetical protein [Streptomyces sp. AA1529]|uniref:hypothetical protein n=1 Tax=Streptomyces sp. AA1529 TaxID=1203257 RepID=UPI003D76551E
MTLDELVLARVITRSEAAADTGYVMTVDAEGWPTGLGRPADLHTGLPPAVLLPAPMDLSALCTSDALDLMTLNPYGVLVHDLGHVLGVLEGDTVSAHLIGLTARGTVRSDTPSPLDAVLAGTYSTPIARVLCRCGRLTTLTAYDPDFPPVCPGAGPEAAPHPLTIGNRAE